MAVTKIWKVRGNAGTVIDYADNPEKVAGYISNEDLEDVLGYADDDTVREMVGLRTVRRRTHSKSTQNMFLLLLCLLTKNYWSYIIK